MIINGCAATDKMNKLIAFAIFFAMLSATGNSLSSAEIPNSGNQIHTAPNTNHYKADNDKKPPQAPMTRLNINTEKSNQGSANESTTINTDKKTDWYLVYFTAALVVVGLLQFLTFVIQARQLRQTNEVMKDTAQRQLRAYICISGGTIKFDRKDAPVAYVEYKNSGQTPAYDVCSWHHIWIAAYPLTEKLPEAPKSFITSRSIIPPGGHAFMVIPKDPPVCERAVHLLGTPEGTIYIYGEIRYRDAFGVERFTKYRLMYGGPEGIHSEHLKPHTEGNEAN